MKLYFSNNDVNSMVYSFAVAFANHNLGACRSIVQELRRLWFCTTEGTVDVEDSNVMYHALKTCLNELNDYNYKLREKQALEVELLEAAEHFNNLWKRYTRQCSI